MSQIKLAVLGFNTDIGKALFELLEDEKLPIEEIFPLSYKSQEYDVASLLGRNYLIQNPENFDYTEANVLMVIGNPADAPKVIAEAQKNGATIIDVSGNSEDLTSYCVYAEGITTSEEFDDAMLDKYVIPMGSAATMLTLLFKPIIDSFGLQRSDVTLIEAVSGLGEDGTSELARETISLLNMRDINPKLFSSQMAFNLHTAIGDTMSDGTTTHENEILVELDSILGNKADLINITSILAPVFYGHTANVTFTIASDSVSVDEIRNTLEESGVAEFVDDEEVTPAKFGINEKNVIISRLRQDKKNSSTFRLIAVMDNAKCGVARNCLGVLRAIAER